MMIWRKEKKRKKKKKDQLSYTIYTPLKYRKLPIHELQMIMSI